MPPELTCPTCGSHDIAKNGHARRGRQNHKCCEPIRTPNQETKGREVS